MNHELSALNKIGVTVLPESALFCFGSGKLEPIFYVSLSDLTDTRWFYVKLYALLSLFFPDAQCDSNLRLGESHLSQSAVRSAESRSAATGRIVDGRAS